MTRHARVAWRAWRLIASVLVLAAQVTTVMPAGATDVDDARAYPARPVHLIVAFSAGTAVDGLARFVVGKLREVDRSISGGRKSPGRRRQHRYELRRSRVP